MGSRVDLCGSTGNTFFLDIREAWDGPGPDLISTWEGKSPERLKLKISFLARLVYCEVLEPKMIKNYPFWAKKEQIERSMKRKKEELKKELDKAKTLIPELLAKKTWKVLQKTEDLTTYRSKYKKSSLYAIFARKTIKTKRSPESMLNMCLRYYTDPNLTRRYLPILHPYFPYYYSYEVEDDVFVIHSRFASGSRMVWDRDYLNVRDIVKKSDDHMYFISCSVPEEMIENDWPKDKECVRGHLTVYYVSARRVNENEVFFEYLCHSDPNGWIPSSIINWKAKEEALILLRYYKLLGKWLEYNDEKDNMLDGAKHEEIAGKVGLNIKLANKEIIGYPSLVMI